MAVSNTADRAAGDIQARIDQMHGRDRAGALAFVIALWVVLVFVLVSIWPNISDGTIRTILTIAGALLLIFNTASIIAMLRHYASDKLFIYSLDLKHLDEMRRQRRI